MNDDNIQCIHSQSIVLCFNTIQLHVHVFHTKEKAPYGKLAQVSVTKDSYFA